MGKATENHGGFTLYELIRYSNTEKMGCMLFMFILSIDLP